MPSRSWSAVGSLLLLVVLTVAGFAAPATATDRVVAEHAAQADAPSDTATTEFAIALEDSGDAVVRIHERRNLTTETERAAFRTLAERFEEGELTVGANAVRNASLAVEPTVEREMSTTEIQRSGSLGTDNTTGTLTAEFRWENFARVEERRLYVDDALDTERGLWLPGLTPDQTLTVRFPEGYGVRDASVSPDEGQLRWRGPATFDRQTLDATFVGINGNGSNGNGSNGNGTNGNGSNGNGTNGNGSNGNGPDDSTDDSGQSDGGANLLPWLVAGLALVVAAAAVLARSGWRDRLAERTDETPTTTEQPPESGPASSASTQDEQTADEAELLSDEERVERLLEEHGGRVKQAEVVEQTDWSDAKVSQLLSSMEEEGRINKLRIGRENLITLPGVDPMDTDSEE
jgi:hypothetical protein